MQETPRIVRFVGQAVFQAISGKEEENGNADMSEIRSQESHVDACMENEDGDYQHEPQSFGVIRGQCILTADAARYLHQPDHLHIRYILSYLDRCVISIKINTIKHPD